MRSTIFLAASAPAACVLANPMIERNTANQTHVGNSPTGYTMGFKNPSVQSSVGGHATCISGMVDVRASANNTRIKLEEPANQTAVTELVVEALQINSTIGTRLIGSQNHVSGTYEIYSQLCFPSNTGTINATTIQFLIHGIGFDRNYWNVAPGYSYIDYAAEQGYTTFSYDRLGTGLSDHPDPIQIVQIQLQLAIGHQLVQLLRTGGISNHKFEHVVGVGHSFGSLQVNGLTTQYPDDFDAAILTGFSADNSGMPVAFAGTDLTIASQNQPLRFSGLSNGYLTSAAIEGNQFFFFRAPEFDPAVLDLAESVKQTISLGEFLTTAVLFTAKSFTGPIDVVNGENDLPNCFGNCLLPVNKAAAVKAALYPAASNESSWYLAPHTGHGLNFHYTANAAYEHILNFIKKNGF
ncbi:MAG: hypothetical protein Q9227_001417 [Pyrenula ochraceoflavens]